MSKTFTPPVGGIETEVIIYQDHEGAIRVVAGILPHTVVTDDVIAVAAALNINGAGEQVRDDARLVRLENILSRSRSVGMNFQQVD